MSGGSGLAHLLVIGGLGVGELLIIVLLLLLLFGSRRIPEIARGLGKGIRNFKSDVSEPDRLDEGDAPPPEDPREGR